MDGPLPEADAVPSRSLVVRVRNSGGLLLVCLDDDVFELSEVSGFIWKSMDGRRTLGQIGELVAERYGVDPATATADTVEVVADLAAARVVRLRHADG